MGYQALLFCPDEKTARAVTQVLSELEFSVEPCTETFAAVKKLMAAHFDAVVVDCDNEQNATLLFKSARNSASNQASLAVAVVEGQAGVAKAFRIGANLVLTKPINIEQAKGTLRVARGLLRKSEAAKPGAASAAPVRPPVTTPVPPSASAPRPAPATASAPKPAPAAAWPAPAAAAAAAAPARQPEPPAPRASSAPVAKPPAPVAPHATTQAPAQASAQAQAQAHARPAAPVPQAKSPAPSAPPVSSLNSPPKPATPPAAAAPAPPTATAFSGGAASAPAPARETKSVPVEAPATSSKEVDARLDTPAAEASHSASSAPEPLPTSFTFGGNALEKSAGSKKVLLGIVAVVLLAVVAYFAWPYVSEMIGGNHGAPASTPAPVSHPATTRPAPAMSAPAPAPSRPVAPAAAQPKPSVPSAAQNNTPTDIDLDSDPDPTSTPAHKSSASAAKSSSAAKPDAAAKPAVAPLVVKGGKVPSINSKSSAPDAPAPSVIGIASAASAPPLDLTGSAGAPRPVLQRVNLSQGVSQGLLIKKIAPDYPREALTLRIEGTVQLLATISKSGDITEVKVLTGDPHLSASARDAVKRWKYKPYLLNGEPVEIQTPITINFKLPQ